MTGTLVAFAGGLLLVLLGYFVSGRIDAAHTLAFFQANQLFGLDLSRVGLNLAWPAAVLKVHNNVISSG